MEHFSLAEARKGQSLTIGSIEEPAVRLLTLRLGMGEGGRARCLYKLPGGPVILALGLQKIAVGRALARRIQVRAAGLSRGGAPTAPQDRSQLRPQGRPQATLVAPSSHPAPQVSP